MIRTSVIKYITDHKSQVVATILLINLSMRLVIWDTTTLFNFSDYSVYLGGIDRIESGDGLFLMQGNYIMGISFAGWFAEHVMGSIDYFFIFNCILGTATSLIIYILTVRISGSIAAGVLAILLHTFYTEFMVFSSVFYSLVIMMFLLSVILLLLHSYYSRTRTKIAGIDLILILFFFLITFFIRPDLKYLPLFLIGFSLFFLFKERHFAIKTLILGMVLLSGQTVFNISGVISRPEGHILANDFIFYGHTDYGGDGGEGAFVYPENRVRYDEALDSFCTKNGIEKPDRYQLNEFHKEEIVKFITGNPGEWVMLQFTKFFRTFGVVPESTTFRILYTGLLNENIWLVAIVTVVPVALIILMLIVFINRSTISRLYNNSSQKDSIETGASGEPKKEMKNGFLWIYLLLFSYYIIATIFYGQYQERYRIPLMALFIIPAVSWFIAGLEKSRKVRKSLLVIKGTIVILFFSVWIIQSLNAISNKERLRNALEKAENKRTTMIVHDQ